MILGVWYSILFRWWYRHLTALAARHDLSMRRKLAAFHYVLVLPFIMGPFIGVFSYVLNLHEVNIVFILIGYACALAPAMIWFLPHTKDLKNLGYGHPAYKAKEKV